MSFTKLIRKRREKGRGSIANRERKRKERMASQEQKTKRMQEKNEDHTWTKWQVLIGIRRSWAGEVWGKVQEFLKCLGLGALVSTVGSANPQCLLKL